MPKNCQQVHSKYFVQNTINGVISKFKNGINNVEQSRSLYFFFDKRLKEEIFVVTFKENIGIHDILYSELFQKGEDKYCRNGVCAKQSVLSNSSQSYTHWFKLGAIGYSEVVKNINVKLLTN
uniref:Uncharacterized protein n=1 Tax=Glossina austeni TaxID=7395 RepID=A0A1A9VM73_GLOAU